MSESEKQILNSPWAIAGIILVILAATLISGYTLAYAERILPGVSVGKLDLGGMTRQQALEETIEYLERFRAQGVTLRVDGHEERILPESIGMTLSAEDTVDYAWAFGRSGPWYAQVPDRLSVLVRSHVVPVELSYHANDLDGEIATVAMLVDNPRRDIRLAISGIQIKTLYDTRPGRVLDRNAAKEAVLAALEYLDATPIDLTLSEDVPHIDRASAPQAEQEAKRMLAADLTLEYEDDIFVISRTQIGKWVLSDAEGDRLVPAPDGEAISQYVTGIAEKINIAPQKPELSIGDGRVTKFIPPRLGKTLEEEKTVGLIIDALTQRRLGEETSAIIALPVKIARPVSETIDPTSGITELIGRATTTFTGSPTNRISNIRNGSRFLSGILIQPGEEFSTVRMLGTIDNTTGYLPELVIKGNATVPEFGGGLCQVSTTLFRAVLNAGLPVTARRNHAYRVSYYEKDGGGRYIGPGLDATIYSPDPDFRFRNDTGNPILIYSYISGTKLTFELYGTSDGRKAEVNGPRKLSEIPPGDPIYTDTDTLPKGEVKQVEKAHPGGWATALYTITYSDARVVKQEFKSYYRPWPARYLVGTGM